MCNKKLRGISAYADNVSLTLVTVVDENINCTLFSRPEKLVISMRGSRNFHERGSNENGNFGHRRGGVQPPQKIPNLPFFR